VKTLPPKFDATHLVAEQMEATSKDGDEGAVFCRALGGDEVDGSNPTILNAYGGFQISETPRYSAPWASSGSRRGACSSWRTSGAAGNSGRPGTRRA